MNLGDRIRARRDARLAAAIETINARTDAPTNDVPTVDTPTTNDELEK